MADLFTSLRSEDKDGETTLADEFRATMEKGKEFYLQRQFEKALKLFTRAKKLKPELFEGYYFAGRALEELKRFDEAIEQYDKVLRIAPTSNAALICRGHARMRQAIRANFHLDEETKEEIIDDYDRAIRVNPDYYWPYFEKAMVYLFLNQLDEAWPLFEKALQREPDDCETYVRAGICLGLIGEKEKDATKLYQANLLLSTAFGRIQCTPELQAEAERMRNYFKTVIKSLKGIS